MALGGAVDAGVSKDCEFVRSKRAVYGVIAVWGVSTRSVVLVFRLGVSGLLPLLVGDTVRAGCIFSAKNPNPRKDAVCRHGESRLRRPRCTMQ